MRLKLTKIAFN